MRHVNGHIKILDWQSAANHDLRVDAGRVAVGNAQREAGGSLINLYVVELPIAILVDKHSPRACAQDRLTQVVTAATIPILK